MSIFGDFMLMAVGKWLHDNPHTHYTSTTAAAAVYMTGFKIYDWRRRLSHMQMTDSDFTLNDWRRRRLGLVAAAPFSTYNYQTEALYEL